MSFWLVLAGALVGFSAAVFIAGRILQAYAVYAGMHVCACPADGTPALVKLRVWRAALSALRGRPSLQVVECSRWPERVNCNQACAAEVEGNCRIIAQFHADLARETGRPWFRRWRKQRQGGAAAHWLLLEFPREFPARPDIWPTLRNVGEQMVHDIQIHPVQRGGFRATFPPISDLVPGSAPVTLRPTTMRDGEHNSTFSSARNDWFAVLFSFDTESRLDELNVPMRIGFSDVHGNRMTEVKRVRCVRPGMIFDVVNLGQERALST
jgi:hypothetical protein